MTSTFLSEWQRCWVMSTYKSSGGKSITLFFQDCYGMSINIQQVVEKQRIYERSNTPWYFKQEVIMLIRVFIQCIILSKY